MSATINLKTSSKKLEQDGLRVNKRKGKIEARLRAFRFIDKDTSQFVIYIPSLEISGYGETEDKADQMVRFHLNEFITELVSYNLEKINSELIKLGWKRNAFHNKEYSNAFVDGDGALHGMNAASDIEQVTLVA